MVDRCPGAGPPLALDGPSLAAPRPAGLLAASLVAALLTLGGSPPRFVPAQCVPGFCSNNPVTVARGASLRLSDLSGFRPSFVKDPGSTIVVSSATPPGPCTPVTGQALLASVTSPSYEAGSDEVTVLSNIFILANHEDALTGIATVANPSFATDCYLPEFNEIEKTSISATNQETPCGLSLVGSSIVPYDAGTGSLNYRYTAQLYCSLHKTTTPVYLDVMDEIVGRAFVRLEIEAVGAPTAQLESMVLSNLTGRVAEYPLIVGPALTQTAINAEEAPPIPLTPALAAAQPTSAVPLCEVPSAAVCSTQPLPAQSVLTLGASSSGGSYEVAPEGRITLTLPLAYQGNGGGPPGLRMLSDSTSGATVTYVFEAAGLPGGQLVIGGPGVPNWSATISVA